MPITRRMVTDSPLKNTTPSPPRCVRCETATGLTPEREIASRMKRSCSRRVGSVADVLAQADDDVPAVVAGPAQIDLVGKARDEALDGADEKETRAHCQAQQEEPPGVAREVPKCHLQRHPRAQLAWMARTGWIRSAKPHGVHPGDHAQDERGTQPDKAMFQTEITGVQGRLPRRAGRGSGS